MKLFLKHRLSSCDGGRGRGGGWRIKLKCVGREAGRWFVFTSGSSCANFGAAFCNSCYVRGRLSFFFVYFCVLFASDTCLLQLSELTASTSLVSASHVCVYCTLILELKTYLNIEEPYVGKVFAFFSVLNLILALTILSAIFQNALSGVKLEKWRNASKVGHYKVMIKKWHIYRAPALLNLSQPWKKLGCSKVCLLFFPNSIILKVFSKLKYSMKFLHPYISQWKERLARAK